MYTKTLYDWDGKPRKYEVFLHPATEGQELLWDLLAIASEPGGAFVQKLLESGDVLGKVMAAFQAHMKPKKKDGDEKDDDDEKDAADQDIADLLSGSNFGSIGSDVRRTLMTSDMAGLAKKLLAHTLRDGKPLSNEVHFNEAYQGNYGEYLRALLASIEANRFFALLGTSTESEQEEKSPTATSSA